MGSGWETGLLLIARFLCLDYASYRSKILIDICPQHGKEFPRSCVYQVPNGRWLNVGEVIEGIEWEFLRLTDQGTKQADPGDWTSL